MASNGALQVVSINVGRPRRVRYRDREVETAIWKSPIDHPVRVGRLNLEGDAQADLTVHGGADKAVYAYPVEHYDFWRAELPDLDLPVGAFGENLTVRGFSEAAVCVGDRYRIGTAELVVTQPRMPCYKLGVRFGRADMVKRFLQSGRSGFYLAVEREGTLAPGDAIVPLATPRPTLTIAEVVGLYASDLDNQDLLQRAATLPSLPEAWRSYFQKRIWNPDT